jgi:hypothetical protein
MVKLVTSCKRLHIDISFNCLFTRYQKHDVKPSRRGWIEGMRALLISNNKEL